MTHKILQKHQAQNLNQDQNNDQLFQQNNQSDVRNGNIYQTSQQKIQEEQRQKKQKYEDLKFEVQQFNSDNSLIQFTSEMFPDSLKTHQDSKLPLAVAIKPFGNTYSQEPLPLVNFHKNPIMRCETCRTYINPFAEFLDNGNKWKCNVCGRIDGVPEYYYCKLDQQGQRTDKFQRPELYQGSYDIIAGIDYFARPPTPPTYFFLIDVSESSIQTQMLTAITLTIKEIIEQDQLTGGQRAQIGFLTFDSALHFYNMNPKLKQPQIIVWSDLEMVQIATVSDLLINVSDNKDMLIQFVESLPKMWNNNKNNGNCIRQAIDCAVSIINNVGGKLIIFQSNANIIKDPHLKIENSENSGQKNPYLHTVSQYFANLTSSLQHQFISCSVYCYSNTFKNMLTLGDLCRYLNGNLYYFPESPERYNTLYYLLKTELSRDMTWESVFRIRSSPGWKTKQVVGNYAVKTNDLLSVPNLTEQQTLIYEFGMENTHALGKFFSIQTALLYTTSNAERRICIHNYQVVLTENIEQIYKHMNPGVISVCLFKLGVNQMYQVPNVQSVRTSIFNASKDLLKASRTVNEVERLFDSYDQEVISNTSDKY